MLPWRVSHTAVKNVPRASDLVWHTRVERGRRIARCLVNLTKQCDVILLRMMRRHVTRGVVWLLFEPVIVATGLAGE